MNDRNSPSLMVHYLNKFKIKTKFGPKSRQLTVRLTPFPTVISSEDEKRP